MAMSGNTFDGAVGFNTRFYHKFSFNDIVEKYDDHDVKKFNCIDVAYDYFDEIQDDEPNLVQNIAKKYEFGPKLCDKIYPKFRYKNPIFRFFSAEIPDRKIDIEFGSIESYILLKSSPLATDFEKYSQWSNDIRVLEYIDEKNPSKLNDPSLKIRIDLYHKRYQKIYGDLQSYKKKDILSDLYYTFLKINDKSFVKYLREYYFPRLISENEKKHSNLVFNQGNICSNIKFLMDNQKAKIRKLFHQFRIYISGSFVLKYLTKFNVSDIEYSWDFDDIDCYVSNDKFFAILQFLDENRYFYTRIKKSSYHINGISNFIEILIDKTKIQMMFVEENPWKFICNNYDFDSCMNAYLYDINRLEINHPIPNRISKMTISELYQFKIFNLRDSYSNYRAAKTIQRCKKYIERGFQIQNLDTFLDKIEKFCF